MARGDSFLGNAYKPIPTCNFSACVGTCFANVSCPWLRFGCNVTRIAKVKGREWRTDLSEYK